jgi:PLD-like domain
LVGGVKFAGVHLCCWVDMTWNNDAHGLLVKLNEIKGYLPSHSWGNKLSQLHKQPDKMVRICAYSVNADYVVSILGRRPNHIRFMCNTKFEPEIKQLRTLLPGIEFRVLGDLHAKMTLIEPDTVYVGSANFVTASLKDVEIGVRSQPLHDHYAAMFDKWWKASESIAREVCMIVYNTGQPIDDWFGWARLENVLEELVSSNQNTLVSVQKK